MNQNEIFEIMDRFEKSGITKLEYEVNGERLVLEKAVCTQAVQAIPSTTVFAPIEMQNIQAPEQSVSAEQSKTALQLKAPIVGVFYESSAPGAEPFVKVGDKVNKGQLLCLIEAMKMINELPSPINGIVKSVFVQNEDIVSFGQSLFEIEPC